MVLFILVFAPLVLAQTCPPQNYPPLTGYSVTIDETQVMFDRMEPNDPDYALRKKLLLGVVTVPLGSTFSYNTWACDQDGDPLKIRSSDGTIQVLDAQGAPVTVVPANGWYPLVTGGKYRWSFKPTVLGVTYHRIDGKDNPLVLPQYARMTSGTIAVVAVQQNKPPTLCGGLP